MKVLAFPGGPQDMLQMLDELRAMVEAGDVRYVHVAVIGTDGDTMSRWSGQSTIIERLGLLRLCEDSELARD